MPQPETRLTPEEYLKPLTAIVLTLLLALWLVPVLAQERPTETEFKGIELNSWRDADGDWGFAFLPGTNRLRSEAEIKRKGGPRVGNL